MYALNLFDVTSEMCIVTMSVIMHLQRTFWTHKVHVSFSFVLEFYTRIAVIVR